MHIHVETLSSLPVALLPAEVVERKGLGHPDSICDGLAEALSIALSRLYAERFGLILHHNVDKALLWAGVSRPLFGGGEVLRPLEIFLAGRATEEFEGQRLPLEELAVETSRLWLKDHLRNLDPLRHARIHYLVRPGSADLADLFQRHHASIPLANDTSFGVGYAPLDELESLVLAIEGHLNAPHVKAAHAYIGEDIKVMGSRRGDLYQFMISCAFVDRHVTDMDDYFAKKEIIRKLVIEIVRSHSSRRAEVRVNTADGDSPETLFLTVTGTSGEGGDDGQVGRGNRVNGLITPYRPMSLEAVAGKNPVSHVGKLYNIAANRIACRIVQEIEGAEEVYCYLLSQIGGPIDQPTLVDLKVRTAPGVALAGIKVRVLELMHAELAALPNLWREVLVPAHGASQVPNL